MADPRGKSDADAGLLREVQADGGCLNAAVAGEVNLHNSPKLRDELLQLVDDHRPRCVALDLSGVPYMDSSAIAVLVELLKEVRRRNGQNGDNDGSRVRLTGLQPRVRGLLHIARLDTIFDMPDRDDDTGE